MPKIREFYLELLREWMDELMRLMVHDPSHKTLDGAILCPACSVVHGRCADAIYPFLCLYAIDGKKEYLEAARRLFAWSGYMLCDDGSMYNDSQSQWQGTTVFSALGLYHALRYHGDLLEKRERLAWEERLKTLAGWLKDGIRAEGRTNVNYIAANAAAMELIGVYFQEDGMRVLAKTLALAALSRVGEGGLIYGEGSPLKQATPRGMSAVDVGYNAEETLPCLYEYAVSCGDADILERVLKLAGTQLKLMLPDGAWDNSFGSRNFKWTYWGSRTADGCQAMFNALGRGDPAFAEAALRNLLLYRRCTKGLLYGGVDYRKHGEQPCAHHAFCRAKALAQVLDEGVTEFERCAIPSDAPVGLEHYPEAGAYRLSAGAWRMSVCYGDFPYMKGGHASGGAITLLWHGTYGPVFAAANTDYSLHEAHNMQLTRRKSLQGSLCPRLEIEKDGRLLSQVYDFGTAVCAVEQPDGVMIEAKGQLCDIEHAPAEGGAYAARYSLSEKGLEISIDSLSGARLVLPLISREDITAEGESALVFAGRLRVEAQGRLLPNRRVFNLAPGFEAWELIAPADDRGHIGVKLRFC